jgi:hypothetical protein
MNAYDLTIASVRDEIGKVAPLQPRWLRVADAVRVSGIGRSLIYQYIKSGKIRSVCLRERDKARGIRLINSKSLDDFIESFEHKGEEQARGGQR